MESIFLKIIGTNGGSIELEVKLPEGKIIVDKAEYESYLIEKEAKTNKRFEMYVDGEDIELYKKRKRNLIRLRKQLNKIISKHNL